MSTVNNNVVRGNLYIDDVKKTPHYNVADGGIPIEFIPGLWVTVPEGLQGRGSGFLLAENIRSVFAIDIKVPVSRDSGRNWTILTISQNELLKESYLTALVRIITESWLDTGNTIIVGPKICTCKILEKFLENVGGIKPATARHIIRSKIA